MDTNWFEDLATLAETGHFSQAAAQNNISQSAFSRRIRALEDWVGAPLVDRSRHPVRLTLAGQQMLEAGQHALSRIESERASIRESLAKPDKYIGNFAAQHSIGWRFYPAWLQALELEFGPIISRLRADDLPNCVEDLNHELVDFVISFESSHAAGVERNPDITSLKIGSDQLVPVCKAHPDGSPQFGIDDANAGPIPFLKFDESAPIRKHIEPILAERGICKRLDLVYQSSLAGALRLRARDGLGVAWLPLSLVQPDIDSGLLAWAGQSYWAIDVDICLHRLERNTTAVVTEMWRYLEHRQHQPLIIPPTALSA